MPADSSRRFVSGILNLAVVAVIALPLAFFLLDPDTKLDAQEPLRGPVGVNETQEFSRQQEFSGQYERPSTGRATGEQPATPGVAVHFVNASRTTIPFTVEEDPNIVEVQLFASSDAGQTWNQVGQQRPGGKWFAFEPRHDGEYLLSTRTIHRNGQISGDMANGSPVAQLKLVVDRRSPSLKIEARPEPTGRVHLLWDATDINLNASSLKIEYRAGVDGPWKTLDLDRAAGRPINGRLRGEMYWYPDTISRVLTLRGIIVDEAGNRVVDVVDRVFLPRVARTGASGDDNSQSDTGADETRAGDTATVASNVWPRDNRLPVDQPGNRLRGDSQFRDTAVARDSGNRSTDRTHGTDNFRGTDSVHNTEQWTSGPQSRDHGSDTRQLGNQATYSPVKPELGDRVSIEPELSIFDTGREPASMTSKPRFHLEYDLEFVGPEGAADVQLWCTRDRGHSWEKWGSDKDLTSPMYVQVDEEGLYGFHIVIVGNNGLASPTPKPNTPPDLWIGVDLTDPKCRLTAATVGKGQHAGHVDIRWEAGDSRLAELPIHLSFGESPDGPWQVIAAELKNDGQHFWRIDNSIPQSVFLKLEVRDAAGRQAQHVLSQPIDTRQVAPRGRIRGFRPVE